MLNTLTRNTSIASTQWSNISRPASASSSSSEAARMDSFVASSSTGEGAGIYNPRMFAQRFASGNSASSAPTTSSAGYGGRQLTNSTNLGRAEVLYRGHGDVSHNLDDHHAVGRLISHSPQIDSTIHGDINHDDDNRRCGGAAIFNAMLLDGDHARNSEAIRATLGRDITPEQTTALDHMRDGRLSPNEAAVLQEGIFDHADALNGERNTGLNLEDMRRTVAELRGHGAFPNTRELNFRREDVGGAEVRAGEERPSHWTVSSRTTRGAHFADSWPQADGCARVAGGEEAAFRPSDARERVMLDSLELTLDNANPRHDEVREVFPRTGGGWSQRAYDVHNASGNTARPWTVDYRG